jgi:hypothetical protein
MNEIDRKANVFYCPRAKSSMTPCEHREWKGGPRFSEIHLNVRGAFPFCPLCGASLTKETP